MAQSRATGTRAYTLIEIMIVMIILIVVMALVAPVIGNARNAAKRTTTRQLLSNLTQASQQFELDNRRMAGYFNEVDMGSDANEARGFTSMNNILADLAGGVVSGAPPADAIQVGPLGTGMIAIRVALIGAPTQTKGVVNKGYFTPDPKFFVTHPDLETKVTNVANHRLLPDLIDGFGQPILAWRHDIDPPPGAEFAHVSSAAGRTAFYRNPNNAFLMATKLGRKEQNQVWGPNPDAESNSLLTQDDATAQLTMAALLGHPSFPKPTTNPSDPQVPAAGRGKLIFHSAGTDGVYLGSRDRGGIVARVNSPAVLDYTPGRDPLDHFDDVISVAGN